MAEYFFDFDAATNGSGSDASPFNTFVGMPLGAHVYRLKRGVTFNETFTFGAGTNGAKLLDYGDGPLPVIDCENTRASGVDLNSRTGCEVAYVRVVNQNAAAPNAGIRVTGTGHYVHHNETSNCQIGIHVNAAASHRIVFNYIDCGNPLTPGTAFGIRVNGAASTNNVVANNVLRSTAVGMTFIAAIQMYETASGLVVFNDVQVPMADGISFKRNTGGRMAHNFVGGPGMLDLLIMEGSSVVQCWNNTAFQYGDVDGHFGPALKMGDDFGGASSAALCDVANNVLVSLGGNNCMNLVPVNTNNTFRGNRLWRPSGGNVVNIDTGSGTSALTFAQWQAAGYSTGETFGDPQLTPSNVPPPNSPLLNRGVDLGEVTDISGIRGRRYIGAYTRKRIGIAPGNFVQARLELIRQKRLEELQKQMEDEEDQDDMDS